MARLRNVCLPRVLLLLLYGFELYVGDILRYLLGPVFFANIGLRSQFLSLWTGERI